MCCYGLSFVALGRGIGLRPKTLQCAPCREGLQAEAGIESKRESLRVASCTLRERERTTHRRRRLHPAPHERIAHVRRAQRTAQRGQQPRAGSLAAELAAKRLERALCGGARVRRRRRFERPNAQAFQKGGVSVVSGHAGRAGARHQRHKENKQALLRGSLCRGRKAHIRTMPPPRADHAPQGYAF